jgi:hypothetical protein
MVVARVQQQHNCSSKISAAGVKQQQDFSSSRISAASEAFFAAAISSSFHPPPAFQDLLLRCLLSADPVCNFGGSIVVLGGEASSCFFFREKCQKIPFSRRRDRGSDAHIVNYLTTGKKPQGDLAMTKLEASFRRTFMSPFSLFAPFTNFLLLNSLFMLAAIWLVQQQQQVYYPGEGGRS